MHHLFIIVHIRPVRAERHFNHRNASISSRAKNVMEVTIPFRRIQTILHYLTPFVDGCLVYISVVKIPTMLRPLDDLGCAWDLVKGSRSKPQTHGSGSLTQSVPPPRPGLRLAFEPSP